MLTNVSNIIVYCETIHTLNIVQYLCNNKVVDQEPVDTEIHEDLPFKKKIEQHFIQNMFDLNLKQLYEHCFLCIIDNKRKVKS